MRSTRLIAGSIVRAVYRQTRAYSRSQRLLDKLLNELRFEEYAAMKADGDPVFREYPAFVLVLSEIKAVECRGGCLGGGCKPGCIIRSCNREKNVDAGNVTLSRPARFSNHLKHPGITRDLQMIRQYGPDDWGEKREHRYPWSK